MSVNVFEFREYKAFLSESFPKTGELRGGRSRLADFLNCKLGFISQVLSGDADFSLEHGLLIAEYLQLSDSEKDFFLLLLQKDRAGSTKLQKHFQIQIDKILKERLEVRSRLKKASEVSEDQFRTYYSKWYYTAIHMCTLIPSLRTADKIHKYLCIPIEEVVAALSELEAMGFIQRKEREFLPQKRRYHLSEKSPTLKNHHTNWRLASVRSLDSKATDDLHYSSVMSISQSAFLEIRKLLLEAVENSEPIIESAKDEGVYTLTIDLFEVGRQN